MPVLKALALVALAIPLASAVPPPQAPAELVAVNFPLVHQVMCDRSRGTAFRVGPNEFMTVAHVAANYGCTINGAPFTIRTINWKLDAAEIDLPIRKLGAIEVSCDGFIPGKWYYAVGYAYGLPYQSMIAVYAVKNPHNSGMQIFKGRGTFIPGMSGGPVLDDQGRAVGTVNAYNADYGLSFSRAFKDTIVCQA